MGEVDWDGQQFLGGRLALAILSPPSTGQVSGHLVVATCAEVARCVVRPENLGAFLRVHRDAVIACHDAGAMHWALADHLGHAGDRAARDALWGFSRAALLVDVGLLDQLVAMA